MPDHAVPDQDGAELLREDRDGVATLTLNRPRARNALTRAMTEALQQQLDAIGGDPAIRVVVIRANGPAFCAGHDMREIRANPDRSNLLDIFKSTSRVMMTIAGMPQIVIARIQGIATAAGCQLVAACDLAVAADDARFATPGVQIGLFCSTPMVPISRNVGRKQLMEMLVTGDMVDAPTAVAHGLINRAVPEAELDATVAAYAAKIKSKSPVSLRMGKQAYYRQLEMPLTDAYAFASDVMTENMMKHDAREGMDAFLEKREPVWRGE